MSILKAARRAFRLKKERNWDTVYWCIDLHGVCLESNYEKGEYRWINSAAYSGMRAISRRPDCKIILWSAVHNDEVAKIVKFFNDYGIQIDAFNANPYEKSNAVSDFSKKFYFSVLLDDKAGFDPSTDWGQIIDYLNWELK